MSSPFFILKTAFSFLHRSWRATFVLAFMIFISVATLVFLFALATGTNDAMIRNSVGLYSGHIQGNKLSASFPYETLHTSGVQYVLNRASVQGIIVNGDQAGMVTLAGIDLEKEYGVTGLHKKVVEGKYPIKVKNSTFIGQTLAKRVGLKVGDFLSFKQDINAPPFIFKVAGIYNTGISSFDNQYIFCNISDIPDINPILSVAVFLKEGVEPHKIIDTYLSREIEEAHFVAWYDFMPELNQLIELNKICMNLLTIIVFAIVAVGVACAFVIFILKNIREYGILKTLGLSPEMISGLIIAKVTLLNVFAAVIGALMGALVCAIIAQKGIDISLLTSHNRYFVISGIIYPRLTALGFWLPPLLSFLFSSLASLWPIILVLKSDAASILRNS